MINNKFLGAPYPITKDPQGYLRTVKGVDVVKGDLLILLLTNPKERCLTGDTKIPLANGEEFAIKELVNRENFWVYSFDKESNSIVAGKACAFKTLENAEIIEVTLDNNEIIKCTEDHLFLLRDGSYCRADQLVAGVSLMPLYRKLNKSGYEIIYQPNLLNYKATHTCFVFEKRLKGEREVVHHKDLNKKNNNPDNLQWMTCKDHIELHKEISNAFRIKFNSDEEFRNAWIEKVKSGLKKYYETHDGPRKGVKLSEETKKKLSESRKEYFKTEEGKQAKIKLRDDAFQQFKDKGYPNLGKKHSEETKSKMRVPRPSMVGENNPTKRPEVREKISKAVKGRKLPSLMGENNPAKRPEVRKKISENLKGRKKNHKVLSIRKLENREDCYDLSVEKFHNFAVSSGVFVHNCMLPNFGTGLRELIYSPNDLSLQQRAREMIINAISTWEPRVSVEQIEVSIPSQNEFPGEQNENMLSVKILFIDRDNIQEVQELRLDVPLKT